MNDINLENLKAGDEVAVIFANPRATRDGVKYAGPKKVIWDEKSQSLRTISETGDKIPKDGKGYFFMSKRITPDYYFSANPEHLKAAKKATAKRTLARKKKEDEFSKKNELLSPMLDSYRDSEENHTFEFLSVESLQKLSIEQIETLKKWLDGGE